MIARLGIVMLTVAAAWAIVRFVERSKGRARPGLVPGLTLVTSVGCRLCPQAIEAADRVGAGAVVMDVAEVGDRSILAVPTAIVVDSSGVVRARRSGRAAITDMSLLAEIAKVVAS